MITISEYYSNDGKRTAVVSEGDGAYYITFTDSNNKHNPSQTLMYPHLILSDVEDLAEDFINHTL